MSLDICNSAYNIFLLNIYFFLRVHETELSVLFLLICFFAVSLRAMSTSQHANLAHCKNNFCPFRRIVPKQTQTHTHTIENKPCVHVYLFIRIIIICYCNALIDSRSMFIAAHIINTNIGIATALILIIYIYIYDCWYVYYDIFNNNNINHHSHVRYSILMSSF